MSKLAVVDPIFEITDLKIFDEILEALRREKYEISFARATNMSSGRAKSKYKQYRNQRIMDSSSVKNSNVLISWGIPTRGMLKKKFNKNVLSFMFGFFPDTWICDAGGFWGDSMVVDTLPRSLNECMTEKCLSWASSYSQKMVAANQSKRIQPASSDEVKEDFIFLPMQYMQDKSVKNYGGMVYEVFVRHVAQFCYENQLTLVIKPHPERKKEIRLLFTNLKKKYGKNLVQVVNGSIHWYCKHCVFMATLNSGAIVDACMNNCVVYQHGKSMFMNSGAVICSCDTMPGLKKTLEVSRSSEEKKSINEKQQALVYYMNNKYLISTDENFQSELSNVDKIQNALKYLEL